MKQYQVSVTLVDPVDSEKQKLSIRVNGLGRLTAENDSEENGNVLTEMFRRQNYVKVAGLEILDPRDCSLTVEVIETPGTANGIFVTSSQFENPQNSDATPAQIQEQNGKTNEYLPRNLFHVHNGRHNRYHTLDINMDELKNADGILFYVNTDHDCNNNSGTKISGVNESPGCDEEPVKPANHAVNNPAENNAAGSESEAKGLENPAAASTVNDNSTDGDTLPPVKIQVKVQDHLQITLTMKESKIARTGQIESSHSALALVSDSDSEYLEASAEEINVHHHVGNHAQNIGKLRHEIFKRLIIERLRGLGFSQKEASNITQAWSNGYVKHRGLSMQTPVQRKSANPSAENSTSSERVLSFNPPFHMTFSGTEIQTDPTKLPSKPYSKPVHSLFHLLDTIVGILNTATCAILEAQYLLVLPHLNIGQPKALETGFHDFGYDCNFMKNWVDIIYLAAHQISINHPHSVSCMANNELKPLKKLFIETHRVFKIVGKNLRSLSSDVDDFRRRILETIRKYTKWPPQFLERKVKPIYNTDNVQMLNFPASDIFESSLDIRVEKDSGLFLNYEQKPEWNALVNLKALEKRLIFISMVDHAKTTMESISTTLGHLKELYTAGYPSSVTKRVECLRSILWYEYEAFKCLPPRTKLEIHGKMDHLITCLERFEHVYNELGEKLLDGKRKIKGMAFNISPKKAAEFVKNKSAEIADSHLIIPFVSLHLHKFETVENVDLNMNMQLTRTQFKEHGKRGKSVL